MERRTMLGLLAASVAAAVSACTAPDAGRPAPAQGATGSGSTTPGGGSSATTGGASSIGRVFSAPTGIVKAAVPKGTLTALPGTGKQIALTVDDGTDARVVAAYAKLCQETGIRLTFFCNGVNPSWTANAPTLRPLLEAGQIFVANHTWAHPDLTKISSARITDEVTKNETYLKNTYGVTGRPFLRPPYGNHNATIDKQLADLGYPAVTMWLGSLADSTVQTPATILSMAQTWFLPQHLVIGHANHDPVIGVMDQLVQLIQTRGLTPVHLGDVFDVTA